MFLTLPLNSPVIDRTGFTGLFDFYLEYAADEMTPGVPFDPLLLPWILWAHRPSRLYRTARI